jgi:hypothetical protein
MCLASTSIWCSPGTRSANVRAIIDLAIAAFGRLTSPPRVADAPADRGSRRRG